jgi:uncharacterized protein YqgC (DUF456 family)
METQQLYWLIALILVVIGLAGVVLPTIPGAPLIFAGLFIAAWSEDFAYVGVWAVIVLGVLAALSYGVDLWATMFGVKRFGASRRAVFGAAIGVIVGLFLGLPGVLFGPFIGAVAGELLARQGLHAATRAGIGATVGLVLGTALKLALAFAMVGIFIFARML